MLIRTSSTLHAKLSTIDRARAAIRTEHHVVLLLWIQYLRPPLLGYFCPAGQPNGSMLVPRRLSISLLAAVCLCIGPVKHASGSDVCAWAVAVGRCAPCRPLQASMAPVMKLQAGAGMSRRQQMTLHVRIKIMEDVVKRLNDPTLEYHRKRETVEELESYLRHIRSLRRKLPRKQEEDERGEYFARPAPFAALDGPLQEPHVVQHRNAQQIEQTLAGMREARVVAVLRGQNAERLVARGLELARCGCKCIEVTLDSPNALETLRSLRAQLPAGVLLGAATVMTAEQALEAISAGAAFVTSPIAAHKLIAASHPVGVLAIPAAFTPTEIYGCITAGARAVKAFPAIALSPKGLKAIRQLGPFDDVFVMAAGGLLPQDAGAWLDAGADAVALGAALVGADVKLPCAHTLRRREEEEEEVGGGRGAGQEQKHASEIEWEERGRAEASALFDALGARRLASSG